MSACRSCGAAIVWVVVRDSGKRMPIDKAPVDGGNIYFTADEGLPPRVRVMAPGKVASAGVKTYVSHFATCSNAAAHRGRG